MTKHIKIIIAVAVVAALAVALSYYFTNRSSGYESHEFTGQITNMGANNILTVKGTFVVKDHPELSGQNFLTEVKVALVSGTKFQKTTYELPTKPGPVDASTIKSEVKSMSTYEFWTELSQNKVSITVKTDKNVFGKNSFTASEIDYALPTSSPLK